jgi:hypothetical protein
VSNNSISTKINIENISRLIETLNQTPELLQQFSIKLSIDNYQQALAVDKRSFHQDIIHLIHCDHSSTWKIYQAMLVKNPLLINIHPEKDWSKVLFLNKLSVEELIALFLLKRKLLMELLNSIDEKSWSNQFTIKGNSTPNTVYKEVRSLAIHEDNHLKILNSRIVEFLTK